MRSNVPIEIELGTKEQRFYDRVRSRLKLPEAGTSSDLRDWMLLLPDLTTLMFSAVARRAGGGRRQGPRGGGYRLCALSGGPTAGLPAGAHRGWWMTSWSSRRPCPGS